MSQGVTRAGGRCGGGPGSFYLERQGLKRFAGVKAGNAQPQG